MNIKIDIVSDVACPWCYVGKKRLEKALAMVPEIGVDITWQPFQLDPSVPKEGRDLKPYYEAKFGSAEKVQEIFEHMGRVGEVEEIAFDFSKMERTMNTLPLHVLMLEAEKEGFKSELKARFFKAYFEDAKDLSKTENLVSIMAEYGWSTEKVSSVLSNTEMMEEVKAKIAYFQSRGVSAVPFFIFNDKYGISGAQPPQTLVDTLRQIQQEMAAETTIAAGESCDVEGGEC
ncbi:DsbA family oxidoreductase [Lacihabitans sp. LS3-19]|uniref:DsbA family oxidoreductase n=1 Tax=Lacihabitans sp. LS3-19 TaxID=2487335 RepID=UPI0020CC3D2C|nr:DsbA family oxidoreductase [Lacihabitans sp. LS3-19]MCP9769175.1 DsbA family oxidoreductase [Lacihabitans sp. LS3-19]